MAMKISGHKTNSIFRRRDIVEMADLAGAAARLDAKQESKRLPRPDLVRLWADLPKEALRIAHSPICPTETKGMQNHSKELINRN